MSTISDIAPLHLKFAPELYLKRKFFPCSLSGEKECHGD